MQTLRIKFVQIWQDFNPQDNFVLWILRHKYNVILDNTNYDFVFGAEESHLGKRSILISGEPHTPKRIWTYDSCLSQFHIEDDKRFVRIPLYIHYLYNFIKDGSIDSLDYFFRERHNEDILKTKTSFCNFIASGQAGEQYRDHFVQKLQKYKKVDCAGTRHNNVPMVGWAGDNGIANSRVKRDFINKYKFTLAFENTSTKDGYKGYTSEKLLDAMVANTLPLYWGNVLIEEEFNSKSFINFFNFKDEDEMIERIIEVDNNDELYLSYMNSALSLKNDNLHMDFLIAQMDKILFG